MEAGLDAVATAHTASDQAETLLMRLSRGAALRGAAAIRVEGPRLLRPLLTIRRAQTEALVAAAQDGEGAGDTVALAARACLATFARPSETT